MSTGFNPNKSQISEKSLITFINEDFTTDLKDIPGIGPAAIKNLNAAGIENTFQLIGKFLMLKKTGMTEKEHLDAFWNWLNSVKVNSHRSGIVRALGLKLAPSFPTLFSENSFAVSSSSAEIADEDLLE